MPVHGIVFMFEQLDKEPLLIASGSCPGFREEVGTQATACRWGWRIARFATG